MKIEYQLFGMSRALGFTKSQMQQCRVYAARDNVLPTRKSNGQRSQPLTSSELMDFVVYCLKCKVAGSLTNGFRIFNECPHSSIRNECGGLKAEIGRVIRVCAILPASSLERLQAFGLELEPVQ